MTGIFILFRTLFANSLNVRLRLLALIICLTLIDHQALAQVSRYALIKSTNASLDLDANGNVIDMSTGTTQIIGPNDGTSAGPVQTLPFTINVNGTNRTQFSIGAHALVILTGATSTPGSNSYFGGGTGDVRLSPFSRNNFVADFIKTSATGKIHWKVVGTAPNRVAVIEYLNASIGTASTTVDGTFQVRLYETTNDIEYVYGQMQVGNGTHVGMNIGFGDVATNSRNMLIGFARDTINTIVNAAHTFTVGPIVGLNSTANGQRVSFRWTPQPLSVFGLTITNASLAGATLSWSDPSINTPRPFRIYASTSSSGPFSLITTTANDVTTINLGPGILGAGWNHFRVVEFSTVTNTEGGFAQDSVFVTGPSAFLSANSGLWSNPSTWLLNRLPTASDSVVILASDTVFLDIADTVLSLKIENTGRLEYASSVARTLTVLRDVEIQTGASLFGPTSGTITTHRLEIFRNLIIDGVLNAAPISTTGFEIRFLGFVNASLFINNPSTNLRVISLSKATSDGILDIVVNQPFTVIGSATAGFLAGTPFTGIYRILGTATASNNVFATPTYTIPTTGGLWLNNPNFTVLGQNGNATLAGSFRLTSGTYNVGIPTALNNFTWNTGAILNIEGGLLRTSGRFGVAASTNAINFTQTGGLIEVYTFTSGTVTDANAGFDLGTSIATTHFVRLLGGQVVIQRPSNHATSTSRLDYRATYSTSATVIPNFTFSKTHQIIFGNANTPANSTFRGQGWMSSVQFAPNAVQFNQSAVTAPFGIVTIPSTARWSLETSAFVMLGDTITVNGRIRSTPTSTFAIFNVGYPLIALAQFTGAERVINGTGSVDSIARFDLFYGPGLKLESTLSTVSLNYGAHFIFGSIVGANKIQIGNGLGAVTVRHGNTVTTGNIVQPSGSFDASPTFAIGTCPTCTYRLEYNPEPVARNAGFEVPPTRNIRSLQVANPNGVNVNADLNIEVGGTLTLTRGKLNMGANSLIVNAFTTGSVPNGTDSTYVIGRLVRTLDSASTAFSNLTYVYPVGTATQFARFDLVSIRTKSNANRAQIGVTFLTSPSGGTPDNISVSQLENIRWVVDTVANAQNFDSARVSIGNGIASFIAGVSRIAFSDTLTGQYSALPSTNVAQTLTTIGRTRYRPFVQLGTFVQFISGTRTVGPGGDYLTFAQAIADYGSKVLGGNLTLEVLNTYDASHSATETFPINLPTPFSFNPTFRLIIKPAPGAQPVIQTTNANAVFRFQQARNIILDGSNNGTDSRDLTIINANISAPANTAAIWVSSNGNNAGCRNLVFRNLNILGVNNTTNPTFGIVVGGTTISATTTGADNDSLTFENLSIRRAHTAFYLAGSALTNPGALDGIVIQNNSFGSNLPAEFIALNGIVIHGVINAKILRNNFFNMGSSLFAANGSAINIGGSGFSFPGNINTLEVAYNSFRNFNNANTSGYGLYGINIGSNTNTSNIDIHHNVMTDITAYGWSTSTSDNPFGIRIVGGNNIRVVHNSVRMAGVVTSNGISAPFIVTSTSATNLDVRNNIFVNLITGQATHKSYSIYLPSAYTPTTIGFNNYFTNTPQGVFGFRGSDVTSLSAWQALIPSEATSISVDPLFNGPNNLVPFVGSPVQGAGTPISQFNIDFLGFPHSATAPTMGAYERVGDAILPTITYTPLGNILAAPNRLLSNFATITDGTGISLGSNRPRIYFKKKTDANVFGANNSAANGWKFAETTSPAGPVYSFNMDFSLLQTPVAVGDIIQYFVVAQDSFGNVASNPSAGFSADSVSAVLVAPNVPNEFSIALPISGQIDVPIPGGGILTLPNLTGIGGVFDTLSKAVIGGPIVVNITDSTIEPGTVGLGLLSFVGASTFPITIVANSVDTFLLEGSSNQALFRFSGASNVTIDGSNLKKLVFRNTNSGGPVFAFTNDANNITLKNIVVEGSTNSLTSGTILVGNGTSFGNRNLTFDSLHVFGRAAAQPANLFYSDGLSPAVPNRDITISNSRFDRFTNCAILSTASTFAQGPNFKALRNHVYYSGPALTTPQSGIQLLGLQGTGNELSHNFVGGSGDSTQGVWINNANGTAFMITATSLSARDTVKLENNLINNLTLTNTGTATVFQGLTVAGIAPFLVRNNTIGDPNSIPAIFSLGGGALYGIFANVNTAGADTGIGLIFDNIVSNIQADAQLTTNRVAGIETSAGTGAYLIQGNEVFNISSATSSTSTTTAAVIGIRMAGTLARRQEVVGNTVYSLNSTHPSANTVVLGSQINASTNSVVFRNNFYHSFSTSSSGATASQAGFYSWFGHPDFINNIVYLDNLGAPTNASLRGYWDGSGTTTDTSHLINNTFVISGSATGTQNSASFYRTSGTRTALRNNYFLNTRLGGTGAHMALWVTITTNWPAGTSNYNYFGSLDSLRRVQFGATPTSFTAYRTTSLNDANSISDFVAPLIDIPGLNFRPADTLVNCLLKQGGVLHRLAPTDHDGVSRPARWPDIGAYQFTFTKPLPVVSVTITQTPPSSVSCVNDTLTFTAVRQNFLPNSTIEWFVNGVLQVGATDTVFGIRPVALGANEVFAVLRSGYPNGCAVNAIDTSNKINFFVNPFSSSLSISKVSGPDTSCAGTPITFRAVGTGLGTAPVYQWFNGVTQVGTNADSLVLTNIQTGDSIYVVVTPNNPCSGVPTLTSNKIGGFVVNPNLSPSASLTTTPGASICEGTIVTFNAIGVNLGVNLTYVWTVNGVVDTNVTGSTYVTDSLNNGDVVRVTITGDNSVPCVIANVASDSVVVTVNPPLPVSASINPVAPICLGEFQTFTVVPVNAGQNPTYQWRVNGQPVGTNSNTYTTNALVPGDSVDVIVTADLSLLCITGSPAKAPASFPTVNTLPTGVTITIPDTVDLNTLFNASATADQGGATFAWDFGAGSNPRNPAGANVSSQYSVVGTRTLSVTASLGGNCTTTVSRTIVVRNVTSVNPTLYGGKLTSYPNPNNGRFYIEYAQQVAQAFVLEVISPTGQMVLVETVAPTHTFRKEMDLSDQSAGVYVVKVVLGDRTEIIRIVKQ